MYRSGFLFVVPKGAGLKIHKKLIYSLLWISAILLNSSSSYATHSAGAELSYIHLGGLDYEITATFYRDCDGINEPSSVMINYQSNSCGYMRTVSAYKVPGGGQDVTSPCSSALSACQGGSLIGITKWEYKAVITLPAACYDWRFSYRVCCRNCSITTIHNPCQAGSELYVEATLDNVNAPSNNSPVFTNDPIAFVCVGQNFNYNPGLYDVDGDSIHFELIDPKTSEFNTVSWVSPAGPSEPVSSSTPFVVDHISGTMNFTPDKFQVGILTARICEYRNGIMIGSTIRDMQIYTRFCNNNIPTLSGINGKNKFTTGVCAGNQLCFDIFSADADLSDSVTVIPNCNIPGMQVNIGPGPLPVVNICWTPTLAQARPRPYHFTLTVKDNACPSNGIQVYNYAFNVVGGNVTSGSSDVTCYGYDDGTAYVNAPPWSTVTWNTIPPSNSHTLSGLSAGSYHVTIDMGNGGCVLSDTIIINQPAPIQAAISTNAQACQAACSGSASVINANGDSLSYLWSTGATGPSITGLCDGSYTVTVTDNNGCTAQMTGSVVSTGSFSVSEVITHISCKGDSSGAISLNVSGGTSPYVIEWNGTIGGNSISGIPAGTYNVKITDDSGCIKILDLVVKEPPSVLQIQTRNMGDVLCRGTSTGHASFLATGGTAPYSYQWSVPAVNTPYATGLPAGSYTVRVTDGAGCANDLQFQISEPSSAISVNLLSLTEPACASGNDGQIVVEVTGGKAPYTYYWNNGSTTPSVNSVSAGVYDLTVVDSNGCRDSLSVSVKEPDHMKAQIVTRRMVRCYGQDAGALEARAGGGVAPYHYLWNTGDTNRVLTGLSAGTYEVTITDARGCSRTVEGVVGGPHLPLSLKAQLKPSECLKGSGGSIELFPFGGTPGYTFRWSNGDTSRSVNGLAPGSYQVELIDSNNCSIIETYVISDNSIVAVQVSDSVICEGSTTVLFTDEVNDATYQWYHNGQPVVGPSSPQFVTAAGGFYQVKVSVGGCGDFLSDSVIITVHSMEDISVSPAVTICPPQSVTLYASGGETYQWSPSSDINFTDIPDPLVSPEVTTVYQVLVTSKMGCEKQLSVPVVVACDSLVIPSGFSPNSDGINDGYVIDDIDKYPGNRIWIFNRSGNLIFHTVDYQNDWDGSGRSNGIIKGSSAPDGTYFYILDLADGSEARSGFIVIRR
jgi:gliding motility-associated-like protein